MEDIPDIYSSAAYQHLKHWHLRDLSDISRWSPKNKSIPKIDLGRIAQLECILFRISVGHIVCTRYLNVTGK